MKNRNPAVVAILSIVTCSIYFWYWLVVTTNEIEVESNGRDAHCRSGGSVFLLSIVTCGIYLLYWWYQEGRRLMYIQEDIDMRVDDYSALYLILAIFTANIVPMILMQLQINRISDEIDRLHKNGGGRGGKDNRGGDKEDRRGDYRDEPYDDRRGGYRDEPYDDRGRGDRNRRYDGKNDRPDDDFKY